MKFPDRQNFIDLLTVMQDHMSKWNPGQYRLMLAICEFIGKHFCDCKYVEYFVFDLDFGRNEGYTEMGFELRNVKTIYQFVDFLYELQDK